MTVFDIEQIESDPLWKELTGVSERTAVIVSAALLEDKLADIIKSRLRNDTDAQKKMFKSSGPLGSLGPKGDLAFLMGIISEKTRDDIGQIGQIRNFFAHWSRLDSFNGRDVRRLVDKLHFLLHPNIRPITDKCITNVFPPFQEANEARVWYVGTCLVLAHLFDQLATEPKYRGLNLPI